MAVQSGGFIAVSYLKLKEGATRRSESDLTNALRAAEKEEEEGEEVPVSELRCPVSLSRRVAPFTIEIPRHFSQRQRYVQRRQIRMVRGCEKFLPAVA